MKISKILGLSAALVFAGVSAAQAAPITATFTGTLGSNAYSYDNSTNEQTALTGQSLNITLTYDTDAVSGANYTDYYNYYGDFSGNNTPGFFTSASITIGNSATYTMNQPMPYARLLLGDLSHYYKDIYYTAAQDGLGGQFTAYFYNFVGGSTTLDPAHAFNHTITNNDTTLMNFSFTIGDVYYSGYDYSSSGNSSNGGSFSSVVVGEPVPAPAALALLGLGLIGLGALRRKVA